MEKVINKHNHTLQISYNEKIVKLNMQEFECIIPRAKLDFIVID